MTLKGGGAESTLFGPFRTRRRASEVHPALCHIYDTESYCTGTYVVRYTRQPGALRNRLPSSAAGLRGRIRFREHFFFVFPKVTGEQGTDFQKEFVLVFFTIIAITNYSFKTETHCCVRFNTVQTSGVFGAFFQCA